MVQAFAQKTHQQAKKTKAISVPFSGINVSFQRIYQDDLFLGEMSTSGLGLPNPQAVTNSCYEKRHTVPNSWQFIHLLNQNIYFLRFEHIIQYYRLEVKYYRTLDEVILEGILCRITLLICRLLAS